MRKSTAVVMGVAGAALALTASSAFTAGGLTLNSSTAGSGFLGGSVEQVVSGTEIANVAYTNTSGDLTQIVLTFTDTNSAGKSPSAVVDDGGVATALWSCTAIASKASTCTAGSGTKPAASAVTKVTFTVA